MAIKAGGQISTAYVPPFLPTGKGHAGVEPATFGPLESLALPIAPVSHITARL